MQSRAPPKPVTIEHAAALAWPSSDSHKHSRGRLGVVAGGALHTGAARLAARAGQRIGAGWVTLLGMPEACHVMACHETSILIVARDPDKCLTLDVEHFDACVIGPAFGLGTDQGADIMDVFANYQGALVLDADALRHCARNQTQSFDLLKARQSPAVLTPHSGEFSALFGAFEARPKAEATREAARQSGSFIVHKGAETVIANPDGELFMCNHATPFLASAGTGDVLAGMIGGLLAQGLTGQDACLAAVWIHGEAARRIGPGLVAEDLILMLPNVLDDLAPDELKRSTYLTYT
jgi:ADP-dependent NAD(P)H-hydrate dehydratase / NAD(P)H-hydrate epimerase